MDTSIAGSTLAGANSHAKTIFPDETIAVISEFAHGIPRIVNNLCENALISGYGKQTKEITPDIIREVASELRLKQDGTSTEGQKGTDR